MTITRNPLFDPLPMSTVEHDEYAYLTPLGIVRGCGACGREVLGHTPLLLPCPAAVERRTLLGSR